MEHGASVDFRYEDGSTPLTNAVEKEDIPEIKFLLEHGASILFERIVNGQYRDPIDIAYKKGNRIILGILFKFRKEEYIDMVEEGHRKTEKLLQLSKHKFFSHNTSKAETSSVHDKTHSLNHS